MFDFNFLNIPEPFTFYLCKPNNEILYELNGIDEESASLTINLNNQYDLSFDYFRYVNSSEDKLVESNGYHDLVVGMKILVDKIGFFKIKYPPMKFDGSKESKTINATSIDCELEDKDLVDFKINMGTPDSLEYLVAYDAGETESLINDYTGLPYDYIVFYNTFSEQLKTILDKYSDGTYTNSSAILEIKSFCDLIPRLQRKVITDSNGSMSIIEYVEFTYDTSGENITSIYLSGFNNRVSQLITFYQKYRDQLSLIPLAIEKCNCNWTIGKIDESLVNKKFQFNINGKNIYSFLTSDIPAAANCVFYFNLFKREIDIVLAKNIGKNSGIVIDRYNLLNSLEVSCNSDNIYTRYNVSGGNNIDIKYVNFGSTRITDLSYFINARNESNQRIYVSDSLAEKYNQYVSDRELARERYMVLTKQYNQALTDIDDLKYKVPNDSVQNDWDSFTDAELDASYKTYHQLLATLQSLYKEDYGKVGCNADGSINENYIRTTEYWYDYYAYKITIEQITAAIHARAEGSRYADIDNEAVLKKINAYKTEWSLYGTVELENKITTYNNSMQVLVDGEAIILKSNSQEAKKWSELNADEKTEYGYYEGNYKYSIYMNLYNEKVSCQSYLNQLNAKLQAAESIRDTAQASRNKLVNLVEIESYNRAELKKIVPLPSSTVSDIFTEEEIQTINLLYVDKNYSNENILTTSLDTTISEIDIQYELLEDAKEQLSIESQPQISFNANIENLLVMSEFKDFAFEVGNFVSLEYYDNYYVDMRLISMTFNPCIPEYSLSVSFSNFIKSKSERTDLSNILELAVGNNSSPSGNGSGNSSGIFGTSNDIDVTISNTMLSKLLNTEMFGTRVSNIILDTIKVNEITAKYAKFEGLAKGTTIIDGKCIMTGYIIDQNYNGINGNITNTKGSVLNLETGYFNFGGGKLKYDGNKLSVEGAISADSGYIGGTSGFVIAPNKMYSNNHSTYDSARAGVYIGTDYISLGHGGIIWFRYDGLGKIGVWNLNSVSIWKGNNSWGANNGIYFGKDGLSIGSTFKVNAAGKLEATGVKISGDGAALDISANDSITNANSRITQTANAITTEVTRATTAEGNLSSRITLTENQISLEVTRAKDAETILSSRITLTENQILLKVSKGAVSSEISLETDKVYIRGNRLVVDSKNFFLDEEGNAKFSGLIEGASGNFSGNLSGSSVNFYGLSSYNASVQVDGINGYIYANSMSSDYLYCNDIYSKNSSSISIHTSINCSSGIICNNVQCSSTIYGWSGIFTGSVAAGAFVETSDVRFKTDIHDIPEDFVDNLIDGTIPKEYRFLESNDNKVHYGMIAQDVKKQLIKMGLSDEKFSIVNKIQKRDKNGNLIGENYYGISYTEYIPALIKYCQGLKKSLKEKEKMYNQIVASFLLLQNEVNLIKQKLKNKGV